MLYNWPTSIPYHSAAGWEYEKEQAKKAWVRYFEKLAEAKRLETLPYYTIFGTETERKADIAKCLLIAERIYKHIMGENAMLNYKGV